MHLKSNFDKIEETVKSPDQERLSSSNPNAYLVYKEFSSIVISEGITVPNRIKYFCVVIDRSTGEKFIKTIYTTNRIKE